MSQKKSKSLKYVQINSFYNGSTGKIMRDLHCELLNQGMDSYIFWGRRHETISMRERCIATSFEVFKHGLGVRLTDRMGFFSRKDTRQLISALEKIDPDVVHLHNIHGYYINVELLFSWLAEHRCEIRWTLHDCWAFTGHCAYFSYVGCNQWKTRCSGKKKCPQLDTYPKTINHYNCRKNYDDKKRIFTSIPVDRLTIVTPSNWLKGLVRESFLGIYPIEVQHNEIDHSIFKPTPNQIRKELGIGQQFLILGVASPWTDRKGLSDFIRLWDRLDRDVFSILLVGLSREQICKLPQGVIGLERTSSPKDLAEIYSAADVFFNPTREDNYPTVNLESEACGTPVITYNVGGCRETLMNTKSMAVENLDEAFNEIMRLKAMDNSANLMQG